MTSAQERLLWILNGAGELGEWAVTIVGTAITIMFIIALAKIVRHVFWR